MTRISKGLAAAALISLAACGGQGDDQAAEQVERSFDNAADRLDQAAENASGAEEERLEDMAEIYRETGEAAADAVDEVDLQVNKQ